MTASRGRAAGFTLIEVMVALALVGVVTLVLLQGVGLAARGTGGLSSRAERLDERRGLEILMRRALATAVAVPLFAGEPAFVGRPASVSFLSLAEDGGPGLYRITLALNPTPPKRFVTMLRRLAGRSAVREGGESVLVRDVDAFGIAYFGADAPGGEPRWQRYWEGKTDLPTLVRIVFNTGGGHEQPPILLRLRDAG
jgi:general secretion pathway protein J